MNSKCVIELLFTLKKKKQTQTKWEGFSSGTRMVRYDEADKIMFDIIKDDWNEFGSNSNTSIRIPTLRTLPGYIEKLKGSEIYTKTCCHFGVNCNRLYFY